MTSGKFPEGQCFPSDPSASWTSRPPSPGAPGSTDPPPRKSETWAGWSLGVRVNSSRDLTNVVWKKQGLDRCLDWTVEKHRSQLLYFAWNEIGQRRPVPRTVWDMTSMPTDLWHLCSQTPRSFDFAKTSLRKRERRCAGRSKQKSHTS